MRIIFIAIILLTTGSSALSQIQRNFKMSPQNTDCDSLVLNDNTEEMISNIESAVFRFSQEMKISRYKVPRKVNFYSCNGNIGFLIATESDSVKVLYSDISIKTWNTLLDSSDPITYYDTHIASKKNYQH